MNHALCSTIIVMLALTACASPADSSTTQPLTADQAATVAADTVQVPLTSTPAVNSPELSSELLPHTLYYLSNDGIYRRDNSTLLLQVYRMERDGKTITRLTNEPNGVDGSNRRVLQLVRSAPDGVTDRTIIRNENFVLMNEALWAPNASFVIVASAPQRDWNQEGGVLEL